MMSLLEIRTPSELKETVKKHCPCHEIWNRIIESEKEMYDAGINSIIAYKVMVSSKEAGLLQYSYAKGGFMKILFLRERALICRPVRKNKKKRRHEMTEEQRAVLHERDKVRYAQKVAAKLKKSMAAFLSQYHLTKWDYIIVKSHLILPVTIL